MRGRLLGALLIAVPFEMPGTDQHGTDGYFYRAEARSTAGC
jgi:hypothetical protein